MDHSTKLYCDGILTTARAMLWYADRAMSDIPEDKFARMPEGVTTNHPAFIAGHLALYPDMLLRVLGLPAKEEDPDQNSLFEHGVACRDDPGGTIYPTKEELIGRFKERHAALLDALPSVSAASLSAPNPIEGLRDMFPTVGELVAFMLTMHTSMHMGQISTWRRCFGMPPCM